MGGVCVTAPIFSPIRRQLSCVRRDCASFAVMARNMEPPRREKMDRKKTLCQDLASSIKVVQEDHVLTKQVKSGHYAADQLCNVLEAIFLHELKDKRGLWRERQKPDQLDLPEPSFWSCVEPLVSDEVKMPLMALRNSESGVKKCRSWVRLMLMKGQLLSFLLDIQKHPGLLGIHYGDQALLKDPERFEIVIQLLKGLSVFEFEYEFTSARLSSWDASVLQLAGIWSPSTGGKKKSKTKGGYQSLNPFYDERITLPPSDFLLEDTFDPDIAGLQSRDENLTDEQRLRMDGEEKEGLSAVERRDKESDRLSSAAVSRRSYRSMVQSYAEKKPAEPPVIWDPVVKEAERQRRTLHSAGDRLLDEYEVVDDVTQDDKKHIQTLTSLVDSIQTEKGLDTQSYQCASCKCSVGIAFGEAKLCRFDGLHYCYECHVDDERIIPARVLFNWDFRKHHVCVRTREFLDSIDLAPVLDIEKVNAALYNYIPELDNSRKLRERLNLLKNYILTCKDVSAQEEFKKKLRSSHFYENIHVYSMKDLRQVYDGSLNHRFKKIIKMAQKHIKQCPICSQKGFLCEGCHKDEIIFSFDRSTYQCPECKAVYHTSCKPYNIRDCAKCRRIELRRAAMSQSTTPPTRQL